MTKYRQFTFTCPACGRTLDDTSLIFRERIEKDVYVDYFACFEDGKAFGVEGETLDTQVSEEYFICAECGENISWNILFNTNSVKLGDYADPLNEEDTYHPENMPDFPLEVGKTYLMPMTLKSMERRFDGGRGTEFYTFETPMGTRASISDHYLKMLKQTDNQ